MLNPRAGIVVLAGIVYVIALVPLIAASCQPLRSTDVALALYSSIHSSSAFIAASPFQSAFLGCGNISFNTTILANGVGVTVGVLVGALVGVFVGMFVDVLVGAFVGIGVAV